MNPWRLKANFFLKSWFQNSDSEPWCSVAVFAEHHDPGVSSSHHKATYDLCSWGTKCLGGAGLLPHHDLSHHWGIVVLCFSAGLQPLRCGWWGFVFKTEVLLHAGLHTVPANAKGKVEEDPQEQAWEWWVGAVSKSQSGVSPWGREKQRTQIGHLQHFI